MNEEVVVREDGGKVARGEGRWRGREDGGEVERGGW